MKKLKENKFIKLLAKPFVWIWKNCRDRQTLIIFLIVMAVMSSEVWVFYLLWIITWGNNASAWFFGAANACWAFWLFPGTPFLPSCLGITIGIKRFIHYLKNRKKARGLK